MARSKCKQVLAFIVSISVLFIFSACEGEPSRNVAGEYEKVKCDDDTDPPLVRLRITKLDGNNFYTEVWSADGNHNRPKMVFGLSGTNLVYQSVPLIKFRNNFQELWYDTLKCSFKRNDSLKPLDEVLEKRFFKKHGFKPTM